MVRALAIAAFALVAAFRPLTAHPLHTSFTEIERERSGHLAISIRLFADDFSKALDSLKALPASQGVELDLVAKAYFERSVVLRDEKGSSIPLEWCGLKQVDNLSWICARTRAPAPDGALRIRNSLMFDRFADQLSIVRWTNKSKAGTRVLSGRAPEAVLN